MKLKSAIIITSNSYPNGDAGAIRQHAMAKILENLGYDSFVIGYGCTGKGILGIYENIKFTSLRPVSNNKVIRIFARCFFGNSVMHYLRKAKLCPVLLIVVDVLPDTFRKIEKFAKKCGSILIHDSVEWYSPEEFVNGKRNIEYLLKEYTNKKAIKEPWKVISISTYLDSYFRSRGLESIRVPAIIDVQSMPFNSECNKNKIVFVYAGGPGRKDYLKEMIEGYVLLTDSQIKKSEFHIIGVKKDDLINICGVSEGTLNKLKNSLVAHGRLPRNSTLNWIRNADFTVLLRNSELRYAKAGFPTKVVESLSCGTPVICNLSSDLSMYLVNGVNACLVRDHTPMSIHATFVEVLTMTEDSKMNMRKAARKTAEESFDFRLYEETIKVLLRGNGMNHYRSR